MKNKLCLYNWMPRISAVVALSLIMLLASPVNLASAQSAVCGANYTVQAGDSLSAIANRCGVSLTALEQDNTQISDPTLIIPGQVINIPPVSSTGLPNTGGNPTPATGGTYTVQSGDTLSAIAVANNVSLTSLIAANPQIPDPNLISPGQVINIPTGTTTTGLPNTGGGSTYIVQSGDTLYGIALSRGVSLATIEGMNPSITNPNLIFPGQQINVP